MISIQSIDITVMAGVLGADEVVGLLGEERVIDEPGAVHQVVQVAEVSPEVEDGECLRDGVGLNDANVFRNKSESQVINISVNWCSVSASSHEAISSGVRVKTPLTVRLGISWLGLTVLVVPEVHLVDDLLLYCVTRLRDSPRNTAFCMEEVLGAVR